MIRSMCDDNIDRDALFIREYMHLKLCCDNVEVKVARFTVSSYLLIARFSVCYVRLPKLPRWILSMVLRPVM